MAALRRLAGLSGASAVGAAAYGAHGLSDADPLSKKAFENGNRMHLVHSVMVDVAPILKPRAPLVSGTLFAAGIAIFGGALRGFIDIVLGVIGFKEITRQSMAQILRF